MARSIKTIYDEMVSEMGSFTSLSGLTTGTDYAASLISKLDSRSRVSIWSLYLWVIAFGLWTLEKLFDNHKSEVEALSAATISGNNSWLVRQVKLFEVNNSTLTVGTDNKIKYLISDTSNRIVAYAAVTREFGRAVLKIAKDSSGVPVPLSSPELLQVATYVNHVAYAGSKLVVVSRSADQLKVTGTIYYDGLLNPSEIETAIQTQLSTWLKDVPFDSLLSIAKVIDQIQSVSGVKDLVVGIYCKKATDSYSDNPQPGPTYMPYAGYIVLDTLDLTFVAV